MKIRREEYSQKRIHTFTDREAPRQIFWEKYEQVKNESPEESSVHVLTYYGIGGMGKSRLLAKLQEELDEKVSKPYYVYTDFNNYQDSRLTLYNLKNTLEKKYKFSFPLFDIGYYCYARKIGEKEESEEIQELTELSPILKTLKDVCGVIPYVNMVSPILDVINNLPMAFEQIKKHLPNHKRELTQIDIKSPADLYKYLPYLFATDLTNNIEKKDEPFVFFIDTYEQLVNELSQSGEPLMNDLWLRNRDGLVQNIPNVLWVIGGREQLKWPSVDKKAGWEDALCQVSLDEFSDCDSEEFLKVEGIDDEKLRKDLIALTKGTPLYLDLCVDQYAEILEAGDVPDISMFGNDLYSLIECFVRYMSDSQKDFIYMLSCLRDWDDELVYDIAPEILSNFSYTFYDEKIKHYSFIRHTEYGYSIHQTVGEVLSKVCPFEIKKRTAGALLARSENIVEKGNIFTQGFSYAISHMLLAGLILYSDNEELMNFYIDKLQSHAQALIDSGNTEIPERMVDMLLSRCNPEKQELLLGCALTDKAYILNYKGSNTQAIEVVKESILVFENLLGRDNKKTLNSMNNLASYYSDNGDLKKALELEEIVYNKYCEILGENEHLTLSALNNLAGYYFHYGNRKKGLELERIAYEKLCEISGEDNPDTLRAMNNLATYHLESGDTKEAFELLEVVYEKRSKVLGENHPDTITTLNNIASCYSNKGDNEKALEIIHYVYDKLCEILGENHSESVNAQINMASFYWNMDDYDKALEIGQKSYDICHEFLGKNHYHTLSATNNLASYYSALKNHDKALDLGQISYEKYIENLGENHPDTINSLSNLATYHYRNGNAKVALEIAKQVYNKYCEIFGERHAKTINALDSLIHLSHITGNKAMEVLYRTKLKNSRKH